MTDGIIQIPKELFDRIMKQIMHTDMYSHGSNIEAKRIYSELRRLGLW